MRKTIGLVLLVVLSIVFGYLIYSKLAVVYFNRGVGFYDRKEYNEAEAYFNKSLKINFKQAVVHYALGNSFMAQNKIDDAIKEYETALKIDPGYVKAYRPLGELYLKQSKFEEALKLLAIAEKKFGSVTDVRDMSQYIKFECAVDQLYKSVDAFLEGKKPRAYELINNALLLSPDFAYSHYTLGYFYYNDNKYDEAIVELKKTIEQTNTFWPAYKLLGDIYFTKNDYADAVEQYKFALNLNFNDAVLNNDLGLALMELERYKEAAEYLKQAAKLDQGDINVRYNLASVLRDLGSYAESAEMFKEVLHLWPDYPGVLADLGDIYKIQGDITEAKSYYDKQAKSAKVQLAKNPNDHVSLNNLARAYNGLKKYDEAKELIKKCLALKPDYRDGYLTLAAIQQSMEEYNAALATLNKAKSMSRSAGFIDRGIMGIKNTIKKFVTIDKVYLKNGRILEGNIKEESDDKLVMELFSGGSKGEITLSGGDIQRIVHAGDPED